ncbi:MAG: ABC transporter permease, partial [Gemmatimonadaceae bacterium]
LIAAAMVVGVALLILFLAIGDGTHAQWVDTGVRLAGGHVTIETAAFERSASVDDRLDSAGAAVVMRALAEPTVSPRVAAAAPRLTVSGLASSASSALPVQVLGVDPRTESRFSILPAKLTAGRFLGDTDNTAAVVGRGLLDRLDLQLGSRFVVTAQTARGEVQEQLLHVAGVFRTGVREVDEGIVIMPLAAAQRWVRTARGVTSVAVLLHDVNDVPAVVRELGPLLPRGTRAFTWRETSPELDAAIRVDNLGGYLFNGILLAIVSLAVLEALLVAVLHRRREFGLLHAIGLSAGETSLVVLGEGMLLALVSGAGGMGLGLGITAILHHTGLDLTAVFGNQLTVSGAIVDPVFYPTVRLARAWQGTIVVLALGVLSSVYPMWQASRIDVADAMQIDL